MERLINEEKWTSALQLSDELLEVHPTTAAEQSKLLYQRGLCWKQLRDLKKCVEEWKRALHVDPNCTKARLGLSDLRDNLLAEESLNLQKQLPDGLLERIRAGEPEAVRGLQVWRKSVLLRAGVVPILCLTLKTTEHKELRAAVWDFLHWFVRRDDVDVEKLARDIDKPLPPSDESQQYQTAVLDAVPLCEICNAGKTSIQLELTQQTCAILGVLRHLGSLDDDEVLEVLDRGLNYTAEKSVSRTAVVILGALADDRRRQGAKVKALRHSRGIAKCIGSLMGLTEEGSDDAEAVLTSILHLLADKERAPADVVDMAVVVENLLDGYLGDPMKCYTEDWKTGLVGLRCVWTADREAAKQYIDRREILHLVINGVGQNEVAGLDRLCLQTLMHCMEYVDMRNDILERGGLEKLCQACSGGIGIAMRCQLCVCLARLCVHDDQVRTSVFKHMDFFSVLEDVLQDISRNCVSESKDLSSSVLEILFFLSMHATFKSKLLDNSHSRMLPLITRLGSTVASGNLSAMSTYLFCGVIHNLAQSRADKEKPKNRPGGLDLDDSQVADLEKLYDALPAEAKPVQNGKVDLGSPRTAEALRTALCDAEVLRHLTKIVSSFKSQRIIGDACGAIRFMAAIPKLRGKIISQGGLQALLEGAHVLKGEDQRRARQAISQLCITTNPGLLAYKDALDVVPHLLELLKDNYELYQYEAALALTNLTSTSEDVRNRVWHGNGWRDFGELLFSENDMLRSAALEGWCNLSPLAAVMEHFGEGKSPTDVKLLFAFCAEEKNPRAQKAASGALATLTAHPPAADYLSQASNFDNILQLFATTEDKDLQVRSEVCLSNILESEVVKEQTKTKIREALKTKVHRSG